MTGAPRNPGAARGPDGDGSARRYRAVVTDLDGTIVHDDTVSAATLDAAADLRRRGVPLIVATARTPAGVRSIPSLNGYATITVSCGGGLAWTPKSGEVLWRDDIPAQSIEKIIAEIAARLPGAGLAAYTGDEWLMTDAYAALHGPERKGPKHVVPATAITARPICYLSISHDTLRADEMLATLAPTVDGIANATYSSPDLLDLSPVGIDKGVGVSRALAALDIDPSYAIAFGDMLNDLPMLDLCGHAVAVGNAHPDVLAAADTVALPVTEDGFARLLADLGVTSASPEARQG